MKQQLLLFVFFAILFASCQKSITENPKLFEETSKANEKLELSLLDSSKLGEIIPLTESPLKQFLPKNLLKARAETADNHSTLYDIAGFPINIIAKENTTGDKFLTSQGTNKEVILAPENSGNLHQRFSLSIMPLTGYVIIKNVEDKLVSAGSYQNSPNVNVLYVKDNNETFAASWNFLPGQKTQDSYILENADVLGSDGEPTIGNVYSKCIGAQGSKIYFDKYRNLPKQEFAIKLIDDFELQSIQYINDATATLQKKPDFKVSWTYNNNSDVQQSITTNFGKKASKTSNFTNKTSFSLKLSTEIKAGVPFIASGKINTEISAGTEFTYGKSETQEDTRDYNIPILVPARTRIVATATVTQYEMNVGYIATLVGKNTGKIIKVAGTWTGVDLTDIIVSVDQTNLVTGKIIQFAPQKISSK